MEVSVVELRLVNDVDLVGKVRTTATNLHDPLAVRNTLHLHDPLSYIPGTIR